MQYPEALDYLYSRLPVFHRVGAKALKPGLANTVRLSAALGNPHEQFRSIHVGGTNGKGSTAHMLAAIYQTAGYRVGLYTSPHLQSFTERIRINGQPIPETAVAEFVTAHQTLVEAVEPSFFEVTVAMAFDYFARQRVEVAIIEVGLGGRLDSTNIITPLVSVITNIGLDHTDLLGDTLLQIAREKAGIAKPSVPLIVGQTQAETTGIFRETAEALNCSLTFADQRYSVRDEGVTDGLRRVSVSRDGMPAVSFALDLLGAYQLANLPAVLATIDTLQALLPVTVFAQRDGLKNVGTSTGLRGRFQTIRQQPRVIADTAHNQPGLNALFAALDALPHALLRVVLGVVADKDRAGVLTALPKTARYYFCQAHIPRALPAADLQREAQAAGLTGDVYADVNDALAAAIREASPNDLIVVTGSNYIIAELTELNP